MAAEESDIEVESGVNEMVDVVCKGLAKYYESMGLKYRRQLFLKAMYEEQGLDDDALEEEIYANNCNDSDCVSTLINWGTENKDYKEYKEYKFPRKRMDISLEKEIFELIKHIYINKGNCTFDVKLPDINGPDFFDVSEQDLEEVREQYSKQCPALWAAGMEQDIAFLNILAVGMKLRRKGEDFRYLEFIINDYFRSRVNNMKNKTNKPTQTTSSTGPTGKRDPWFEERHVKFVAKLGKTAKTNPKELVQNAVKSFGARCCPKLMFASLFSIDDSIEIHCQYIIACLTWISEIIEAADKTKQTVCPFQIDLCFAVGQPASTEKKNKFTNNGAADDSDDDDDDDDEKGSGPPKKYEGYVDCIGDIEGKLKANNLKYTISPFNTEKDKFNSRFYNDMMTKLKAQLNNEIFPLKGQGSSLYPHRSRFITMIDRREKKGKDNVFMYTAPGDCRDIPKDVVPEWFVSSSKSTILPSVDYGDGQNALKDANKNNKDESKEKLQNSNINSGFHAKGGLLTMSFIVEEAERIKAYLYYNGQMHYFQPQVKDNIYCFCYPCTQIIYKKQHNV